MTRRLRRPVAGAWAFGLVVAAGLAVPGRLSAKELLVSPFRGVTVPAGTIAGDADGTAVELNPGLLGLLPAGSSALLFDYWPNNTPRVSRGGAFMLGAPLFMGSALGLGFQWLRPSLQGEPADYQKLQLALALRPARGLGLGLLWEHLFSTQYATHGSVTLGAAARLSQWLSAGVVARDIARPQLTPGGPRVPREWGFEAVIRPLATERLELSGGLGIFQGSDTVLVPRARVSVRAARGLALFAQADWPFAQIVPAATGPTGVFPADHLAMLGLTLEEERLGVTAAGMVNWRGYDEGEAGWRPGGSLMFRSFAARHAPLLPDRYVARVHLGGLESDRAFVERVLRMRRLLDDPAVAAVLLDIDSLGLGLGRVEELRALIAELKQRKPVVAQVTDPSTLEYYLASACDGIVIDPAGHLFLTGMAQTLTFFKQAMDRLGVHMDLVRIAEYKGAMEPFVMNEQSAPVAANRNALLDDDFEHLLTGIAEGRAGHKITPAKLRDLVDRGFFTPAEALDVGLVDGVTDEQALVEMLPKLLGQDWPVRSANDGPLAPSRWTPPRVAVIMVEGTLMDGSGGDFPLHLSETAWSDRIIAAIEEAATDSSVRAVVLRVNSPGGAVLGSDRIARTLARLRKSGKPVLASMGDVAASGGYYISAPATEIFASPSTLTGSIGIFAYKLDVVGLLGHLSISAETFKRGRHADFFSNGRPWTDDERAMMLKQLTHMYQRFLDTIAEGRSSRGITAARANELGRGRLWSGAQAVSVKLVDRLGGIAPALEEAAHLGNVPVGPGGLPEILLLPRPVPTIFSTLARIPGGRAVEQLVLPVLYQGGTGMQARLPFDIESK